jgi:ribonuclease R
VTVTETGASGIVPFGTLSDDYWHYDEREQTLTGRRTQKVYRLAQEVEVLLSEANPVTGGMVFHVLEGGDARLEEGRHAPASAPRFPPGKRPPGKPPSGKRPSRR